ncbi:hypothetical protein LJB83_02890 [Clostridia bacterium OttesenSCG-928-F22]|nr:hypothetical protein [Clostridia bacterium OttesenSCG-928-F22]
MKNRSNTTGLLIEIMIAILFFCFACGIILQIFHFSKSTADNNLEQTKAMYCAQSITELFYSDEDFKALMLDVYGNDVVQTSRDGFIFYCNENMQACTEDQRIYDVTINMDNEPSSAGALYTANINITKGEQQIYTISVDKYFPNEVTP